MLRAAIASLGLALAFSTAGVSADSCDLTNGAYTALTSAGDVVTSLAGNNLKDRPVCGEVVPFTLTFGTLKAGDYDIPLDFEVSGNNGKSAGWAPFADAVITPNSNGETVTVTLAGDTQGQKPLTVATLHTKGLKEDKDYSVTIKATVICDDVDESCKGGASFTSYIDAKCPAGTKTIPAQLKCKDTDSPTPAPSKQPDPTPAPSKQPKPTPAPVKQPTGGAGQDPHIWGYNNEGFYFYGETEHYYAMIHDRDVSINIRTAPRFAEQTRDLRDIVSAGLSVRTPAGEHRVGIFNAIEACAAGFDTCDLPPFAVATVLDGTLLPLGLTKARDIEVAVMNAPYKCKFDHNDFDEAAGLYHPEQPEMQRQRRLRAVASSDVDDVASWLSSGLIIGAPSESNDFTNECLAYLDGKDIYAPRLDGRLTTVLIKSPVLSLRVEAWFFDDADAGVAQNSAAFVPANGAVPVMLDIYPQGWTPSETAHGLLGQTIRPVVPGQPPMQGKEADYIVSGPYATTFSFYP